ncbi:MAG: hypothetical protein WBG46_02140 [Nonlabens sp.]
MKNNLKIASVLMLILAVAITYLGLQRESIFNPPVVTGVGFLVTAWIFFSMSKK